MKKHLKKILIILLIICGLLSFNFVGVKADSGWDTDYDSGGYDGGWSGGGYDSDWGDSDIEIEGEGALLLTLLIFFIVIIVLTKVAQHKNEEYVKEFGEEDQLDDDEILKMIPNFNIDSFLNECLDNFIKLQNAWSEFDYEAMKPLLSDELYNNYVSQLKVLKAKKQKNVMSDFEKDKMYITAIKHDKKIDTIEVKLLISFYDYVIDKDEEVVRGTDTRKVYNEYVLTYSRKTTKKKKISVCPNCGEKLKKTHTSTCEYCKTIITNNDHDWVLTKKEIID